MQNQNIANYSVTADATNQDPGSLRGGIGQVTFGGNAEIRELKTITDPEHGTITVQVRDIMRNAYELDQVTGDSSFIVLNTYRTVQPFQGTIQAFFNSLNVGTFVCEPAFASDVIIAPGYVGNLWDYVRDFLSAHKLQMYLLNDEFVVERPYTRDAETDFIETFTRNLSAQNTAQSVVVNYFNHRWSNQVEVYPLPSDPSPSPFVVGANEFFSQQVKLDGSLKIVNQPQCVAWVDNASYEGTNGVYAVASTADNLPIQPAEWLDNGGRLEVVVTDDPSVIEIRVYGANIPDKAPFRIAMTSGNFYNSLHITGEGHVSEVKSVKIYTGSPLADSGEEVGIEVINPHISTLEQAFNVGQYTQRAFSDTQYSVEGRARKLLAQDDMTASVGSKLGNYRVDSTTTSFEGISFNATMDMTLDDFNALTQVGSTFNDFNNSRPVNETFRKLNDSVATPQFTAGS